MQAIKDFESCRWDANELRPRAASFDRTVFANRLIDYLQTVAPGVLQANAEFLPNKRTSRTMTAPLRPAKMAD